MIRLRTVLRRLRCALSGHALTLQLDPQVETSRHDPARVYLRCEVCLWTSPGWALDRATPIVRGARIRRFRHRLDREQRRSA
jgi:hypothetical protein